MPTLDQAARQLGISEKTLRRWIKLLNQKRPRQQIVPTRHEWDGRYFVIRDEDVTAIREARAQMPGYSPAISIASKLAFDRRSTADGERAIATDSFSPVAPMPRPRSARTRTQFDGGLPDGWMSRTRASDAHGLGRTTVNRWIKAQGFETGDNSFGGVNGQFQGNRPLTQRGLAQLVAFARAHQPQNFHTCELCPHASAAEEE